MLAWFAPLAARGYGIVAAEYGGAIAAIIDNAEARLAGRAPEPLPNRLQVVAFGRFSS